MNNNMYVGVVEDRNDPEKMNRVKVRWMGVHNREKDKTKLDELPWSIVMMPVTGPAISGYGNSPHALVEGSWVVGFFRDTNFQDAIVIGSVASKYNEKPSDAHGFADPNGKYPEEEYIGDGTNDMNQHAREETTEEVDARKEAVVKEIKHPNGQWDEPETPFAPVYPFNKVTKTESGHLFEVDDTEGAERLYDTHMSGTRNEVFPDGTKVTTIVGDNFQVYKKNKNVYVVGDYNITVDGDVNIQCENARVHANDLVEVKCVTADVYAQDLIKAVTTTFTIDASEKMTVTTPTFTVNASSIVKLNTPMTDASGEVKDKVRTMSADRSIYNGHKHPLNIPKNEADPTSQTQ